LLDRIYFGSATRVYPKVSGLAGVAAWSENCKR